ncbi:MAG: hypothetical protein U0359_20490 [Byssovorax sp.]
MLVQTSAIAALAILALGCGATTVRAAVGPTLDGQGKPGVEASFGLGIGTPLDFHGRSRHYLQVMPSLGGGLEGRSRRGQFRAAADVDYIYWAGSRMDFRAGMRLSYRSVPNDDTAPGLYGLGGHFGLLPVIVGDESGWLVTHFSIGPELHVEYLWSDPAGASRPLVSLPLAIDLTFLGAGD